MTMSAVDFLTNGSRPTCSGHDVGVRNHRDLPGSAFAGNGLRSSITTWENHGAFRAWGFARGGTGAISNAIAEAAREAGAEIRTESPIAKILTKNGRATGVALESGEEIGASVVSSSVDPRLTFFRMVGRKELPEEFAEDIERYKFRGSSGKVNLALDGLPDFTCLPGPGAHLRGAISISPSVEYMERAYDDAKYGRYSRRPYIIHRHPEPDSTSVAPPGKAFCAVSVQRALSRKNGDWDKERSVRRHGHRGDRGVRSQHPRSIQPPCLAPAVGEMRSLTRRRSELFPHPVGPRSATNSPSATARLISASASTGPRSAS